jgi:thiol-disulfide isomerase/thioredoxin
MNYLLVGVGLIVAYYIWNTPAPLQPGQKSLTLYWWSKCGHCHTFMPTFNSLNGGNVKLRKVESSQNQEYEVNSFPTLIYRDERGVTEKYEGGRSLSELNRFLMSKQ